jgi:hypothetical protein
VRVAVMETDADDSDDDRLREAVPMVIVSRDVDNVGEALTRRDVGVTVCDTEQHDDVPLAAERLPVAVVAVALCDTVRRLLTVTSVCVTDVTDGEGDCEPRRRRRETVVVPLVVALTDVVRDRDVLEMLTVTAEPVADAVCDAVVSVTVSSVWL